MNYSAIVLAAGVGSRMNLGYNKMFLLLDNKPLFILSLEKFLNDPNCKQIILIINKQDDNKIKDILREHQLSNTCKLVYGGQFRQQSVHNGIQHVKQDIVLVHDGARPFIDEALITSLVKDAKKYGCAIPAVHVKDTIKIVKDDFIEATLPRESLYAVQTPQACDTLSLKNVHEMAQKDHYLGTDEASLLEKYLNMKVKIVLSSYENIKITTSEDLIYAKNLYPKYFK